MLKNPLAHFFIAYFELYVVFFCAPILFRVWCIEVLWLAPVCWRLIGSWSANKKADELVYQSNVIMPQIVFFRVAVNSE